MRTIVLDSGAFLAMERRNTALFTFLRAARLEGAQIVVPATVIPEIRRDPPRHQNATLLDAAEEISVLDDRRARVIGTLLGVAGTTQIVDSHVCTIAVNLAPSLIVTSDPKDMKLLIAALGARGGSRSSNDIDVVVYAI